MTRWRPTGQPPAAELADQEISLIASHGGPAPSPIFGGETSDPAADAPLVNTKLDYTKLDYTKLDYTKLDYTKLDYTKLDCIDFVMPLTLPPNQDLSRSNKTTWQS